MNEPQPIPDEAGRPQPAEDAVRMAEIERRLRRLAQALTVDETRDTQDCRRVRQMLPRLAEAELRGERIARLFPDEVAHMDRCEECAMAYAELLDALMSLEDAVDEPQSILPPPLPARLTLVMRLRGWVVRVSKDMVAALQLADPANFEAAAQALLERLPELSHVLTPRQAEQMALGWGTDTDAARLMLACWDATEHIVGRYQAQELENLAASGRLPDVAREAATDTAKRLKLGKLRARFVELYVAEVHANPSSLAALARLGS